MTSHPHRPLVSALRIVPQKLMSPLLGAKLRIQSSSATHHLHNTVTQHRYCTLLACGDGSYAPKVGLQKIFHRGQTYVVHDIFGLDHTGERESEGSRECVVCMSEPRDTTVLPCRHLCVCAPCADLMRMQTNKCPICRAPVTSLLSIYYYKKKTPNYLPITSVAKSLKCTLNTSRHHNIEGELGCY